MISQPDKVDPGAWRPSSMPATAHVQLPERIIHRPQRLDLLANFSASRDVLGRVSQFLIFRNFD
jgi:hypothetical protein